MKAEWRTEVEESAAKVEHQRKSLFADKDELRRIMAEQNEKMGFVPVPGATAEMAQAMSLAAGIRPEDNAGSREIMRMRYGDDWEAEQMAVVEAEVRPMFADKTEIRKLVAEVNERMGLVPGPLKTPAEVREMMRAEGIRPEDNAFTSELMRMRYEED